MSHAMKESSGNLNLGCGFDNLLLSINEFLWCLCWTIGVIPIHCVKEAVHWVDLLVQRTSGVSIHGIRALCDGSISFECNKWSVQVMSMVADALVLTVGLRHSPDKRELENASTPSPSNTIACMHLHKRNLCAMPGGTTFCIRELTSNVND